MQKAIAKYGLAAHLALLAVAPLVLFPFCANATIAVVLLWLSLFGACWILLGPSVHTGEMLHDARRRVMRTVFRDPLFWAFLVVVVVAGLRALNTGIDMIYDYERREWSVTDPPLLFLPGSVSNCGLLPFAASVAAGVVVMGCRKAMGKSARMAFLLMASLFSGLAAAVAILLAAQGDKVVLAAFEHAPERLAGPGAGFAVYLMCATVAMFAAFERKWNKAMPLVMAAVAGNAAGLFAFLPPLEAVVFAGGALLVFLGVFVCAWRTLNGTGEFKLLVVFSISLVMGGLLVVSAVPEPVVAAKCNAIVEGVFLPQGFMDIRSRLSAAAFKAWSGSPWAGVGMGAFRFHLRFHLAQADWAVVPKHVIAVSDGWWQLVVERGIVGVALMALPFGFLLFTYFKRMVACIRQMAMPGPAVLLAPVALAAVAATAFFGSSPLRPEVLVAVGAAFAISANSFPKRRGKENG